MSAEYDRQVLRMPRHTVRETDLGYWICPLCIDVRFGMADEFVRHLGKHSIRRLEISFRHGAPFLTGDQ